MQITNVVTERKAITTDVRDIRRITIGLHEQLCDHTLESLNGTN